MSISGITPLPGTLTSGIDSVATRNLEDATKARRALEITQREAEKTTPAKSAGLAGNGSKTAETLFNVQDFAQQFKDYMDKTPEQLMREEILKALGYTEEDLASMSPQDRAKAETKIRDALEKKIEESMREKGIEIDIGALPAAPA